MSQLRFDGPCQHIGQRRAALFDIEHARCAQCWLAVFDRGGPPIEDTCNIVGSSGKYNAPELVDTRDINDSDSEAAPAEVTVLKLEQ